MGAWLLVVTRVPDQRRTSLPHPNLFRMIKPLRVFVDILTQRCCCKLERYVICGD